MDNFIITPLLGEQVGLQYAGLTDQTESQNITSNGVPLVMGFFRRGTPYKVIAVTKFTIKSILGYEPNNPHYKTIESMLAQNVGVVNVLNLGTHKGTSSTDIPTDPTEPKPYSNYSYYGSGSGSLSVDKNSPDYPKQDTETDNFYGTPFITLQGKSYTGSDKIYFEDGVIPNKFITDKEQQKLIESVSLYGIKEISKEAFQNQSKAWNNLTKVNFGSSLKSIGASAFLSSNISEIILPDSCNFIDEYAFSGCTNVSKFQTGTGLKKIRWISSGLFSNNPIGTLTLNENITSIGDYSMVQLGVKNLVIGSQTTLIDVGAFSGSETLETVKILSPNAKVQISEGFDLGLTFGRMPPLKAIYVPRGTYDFYVKQLAYYKSIISEFD